MIKNGKSKSGDFTRMLTDNSDTKKFHAGKEFYKLVTSKSNHTLPAIFLASTENIPTPNPEKYIAKGDELREELSNILSKLNREAHRHKYSLKLNLFF